MMGLKRAFIGMAVIASMISGQAAIAAESVYMGDCERARTIQQQSTIDKLITNDRYEGIIRSWDGTASKIECDAEQLSIYTLSQRSRTTTSLVYDLKRLDLNYGRKDNCMTPFMLEGAVIGTVTFTTRLDQKGELCELFIWSAWVQSLPSDPKWKSNFSNRVISFNTGSFMIAQTPSSGGKYKTPMAFTGVNP